MEMIIKGNYELFLWKHTHDCGKEEKGVKEIMGKKKLGDI